MSAQTVTLANFFITVGLILFLLAIIPAYIAAGKGRNIFVWLVYGFFFWIVALVHSIVMPARRCPFCDERIRLEAKVCPHCQSDLTRPAVASNRVQPMLGEL